MFALLKYEMLMLSFTDIKLILYASNYIFHLPGQSLVGMDREGELAYPRVVVHTGAQTKLA